ncbi:MAG: hypothetical protein ACR2NW_06795 [Thermodesulfobacteriota bacterium]
MATKKKVLGVDPLSWIKETKIKKPMQLEEKFNFKKTDSAEAHDKPNKPKFESYDVKLTIRLNESQLDFLTNLEREIMKKRSKENKKERITKNSIIRSMLNVFSENDIEFNKSEIPDEDELTKRIWSGIKL